MRSTDYRSCFHCGQPHRAGLAYSITLGGERQGMCCTGCQLVAALIAQGKGLQSSGTSEKVQPVDSECPVPSPR